MSQPAVLPLDWNEILEDRGDGSSEVAGWEADSGFGGYYSVDMFFGSDSYGWEVSLDYAIIGSFDDPDQAKAAAQADFELRIRAALAPSPIEIAGSEKP